MRRFICQEIEDEDLTCICGKEIIGMTIGEWKPIHKGSNGEMLICEHVFKVGDYVKLKHFCGHFNKGEIAKIYSVDGLNNYSLIARGSAWDGYKSEDLEKTNVPKYYDMRYKLKIGCVFMQNSKQFIVEEASSVVVNEDNGREWEITARELNLDGSYNPNNRAILFRQREDIEVIDYRERKIDF